MKKSNINKANNKVRNNKVSKKKASNVAEKNVTQNDIRQPILAYPIVNIPKYPPHKGMFTQCPFDLAGGNLSRSETEYLSQLKSKDRELLLKKLKSFGKSQTIPTRFRILASNLPNKADVLQRLVNSHEGSKYESWVESLLNIPFGRLAPPPVDSLSRMNMFLVDTKSVMDRAIFGQQDAKEEILRLLCQWISSGCLKSFAIGLEGEPGIGKTTFAKRVIANVMNRPFHFISLGGCFDSAFLTGHSYTYEGAIPGKIADCLKKSKVMNPCFYFDELDKISKSVKGDEITNTLIHITDREQNSQFHDKYFNGVDLDVSNALFAFSYNSSANINPVLLDRLHVIKFKSPTSNEKLEIAKQHLLPRLLAASALTGIVFPDDVIEHIVLGYTSESGVRSLEKKLTKVVTTINVALRAPGVCGQTKINIIRGDKSIVVSKEDVDIILGDAVEESSNTNWKCMYM